MIQDLMKTKAFTTVTSRCMVEHIKLYAASTKIPEYRDWHKNLMVLVNVVERTCEESDTGILSASYDLLGQIIKIDIVAPVDITNNWFSKFIPSFKRSLRHELEHYTQHVRGGLENDVLMPLLTIDGSFKGKAHKGPWKSAVEAARYLLNPLEIEAHVVGIRQESKARRVKFHVVLKEVIGKIGTNLRDSGFDETKISFMSRRLYQVWGFYALARYSSLRRKRPRIVVYQQKSFDFPADE